MIKVILFSVTLLFALNSVTWAQQNVSGVVFHDLNENGRFDTGEPGVPGVLVTNGRDITVTDENGHYRLSADDYTIISVIKPRDWTTYTDDLGIPQFFYIHSVNGAGGSDFPGLQPTGPLPESVDFALYPQQESEAFRVLVFGDTQPRDLKELGYIAHDSVQELIGVDAAFGTTLGDLVFDDLDLFGPLKEVIGQIGIPWRHVIGNHDIDFSADENHDVRGAYFREFGPSWYAFSWGGAHFVAVDNIRWIVDGDERYYRTGLGEDQMEFIANFLEHIPDDELVVYLMHIPWVDSTPWADEAERDALFKLLSSHPESVSLAAHRHMHYHWLIDEEDGWPEEEPHHLVIMGTVCGSWWEGTPDEYGIPHAMMRDGSPTGYAFLNIDGTDWNIQYKAARRPADFQMSIFSPDEIQQSDAGNTGIYANIFNALPDAVVEMRVGKSGSWIPMNRSVQQGPTHLAMRERELKVNNPSWRLPGRTYESYQLWITRLPDDLEPGTYTIFIRSTDDWHVHEGRRIIRVTD